MEESFKEKTPKIEYSGIAMEIAKMYILDQDMRHKALENNGAIEAQKVATVDRENTDRMKEIVSQIGWPSLSKVGKDASFGAWLLVQHADHDVEFQSYCLSLMKDLPSGEVRLQDIALLTDRIQVNKGERQIYGTQFRQIDGKHVPKEIEDIENVNKRRKEMGLDTLEEHIERMYKKYPM